MVDVDHAKEEFFKARDNYVDSYKDFLQKLMTLLKSAKSSTMADSWEPEAIEAVENLSLIVTDMRGQLERFPDDWRSSSSKSDNVSTGFEAVSQEAAARGAAVEMEGQTSATPELERLMTEAAEKERLRAEEAEQERLKAEEAEQERLRAEEAEQERLKAEEAEQERLRAEEAEQERLRAVAAEQERVRAVAAEQERLKALAAEQERLRAEEAEQERLRAEEAEAAAAAASLEEEMPLDNASMKMRIVSAFYEFRYHRDEFRQVFKLGQVNNSSSAYCPAPIVDASDGASALEEIFEAADLQPTRPRWLASLAEATVEVLGRDSAPAPWLRLAEESAAAADRPQSPRAVFAAIPSPRRLEPALRRQVEAMLLALQLCSGA